MSSSLTFSSAIPDKKFFPESEAEENKEMRVIQSRLEQGDCNQIKTDSHLLRGKEKGRWALRPEWILGIRGEMLRRMEKEGMGVHVRV